MRVAHNKIMLPRDELERLYIEENLSSNEIARQFGCNELTVIARLREYGIPIKPRGWHKLVRRVPDAVLDLWPSPELAYIVGLVASDGNLPTRNNCMVLVSTDKEIVDLCATLLQLNDAHIVVSNQGFPRKTSYILQVCDYKFRELLEALGITPNKTYTIGALDVPDSVFADFLRGELDGDGGWLVAKGWRGVPYLVGKFTSRSQPYLEWLHGAILRLTGIDGRLQKSRLFYNGKKAEQLANGSITPPICLVCNASMPYGYSGCHEPAEYCLRLLKHWRFYAHHQRHPHHPRRGKQNHRKRRGVHSR